jgi:hypothetical protein
MMPNGRARQTQADLCGIGQGVEPPAGAMSGLHDCSNSPIRRVVLSTINRKPHPRRQANAPDSLDRKARPCSTGH